MKQKLGIKQRYQPIKIYQNKNPGSKQWGQFTSLQYTTLDSDWLSWVRSWSSVVRWFYFCNFRLIRSTNRGIISCSQPDRNYFKGNGNQYKTFVASTRWASDLSISSNKETHWPVHIWSQTYQISARIATLTCHVCFLTKVVAAASILDVNILENHWECLDVF